MAKQNEQKKEMGLVSREMYRMEFETIANIKQVYSKKGDKFYTIITLGQERDKKFLVAARKDGRGTVLLTDWEQYIFMGGTKKNPEAIAI